MNLPNLLLKFVRPEKVKQRSQVSGWGRGSYGKAPANKCQALSSNPSATKKKNPKVLANRDFLRKNE
jgi:hypothetical protein